MIRGGRKGEMGSLGKIREVIQQSDKHKVLGEGNEEAESIHNVTTVTSPVKNRNALVEFDGRKVSDIPIAQVGDRVEGVSEFDKELEELGTDNGIANSQELDKMLLGDNRDGAQNETEREIMEQGGWEGEMEIEGVEGDNYVIGSVRPSLKELNIKVNNEEGNQHRAPGNSKNRTWKRIDKGERKEKAQIYDLNKENAVDRGVKRGREADLGEAVQIAGELWESRLKSIEVEANRISPKVGVASHNWTQVDK